MDLLMRILQAVAPGLIVGVVLAIWNRQQNVKNAKAHQQSIDRVESEMRELDLVVATAQLSYAVAVAVRDGKTNGEMKAAVESYETAMEKFRKFERKQLAKTKEE